MIAGAWVCAAGIALVFGGALVADTPAYWARSTSIRLLVLGYAFSVVGLALMCGNLPAVGA